MGPTSNKKGFKEAIKQFAEENEWAVGEIDKESATLDFETEAGGEYTLYLDYDEDTLNFSVPSATVFENEEDLPGEVSTELLKRNSELDTGFWAIEELEDGWGYVLYHDQKLPNKDFDLDLDADTFRQIVDDMIEEVEEFDDSWEDAEEE